MNRNETDIQSSSSETASISPVESVQTSSGESNIPPKTSQIDDWAFRMLSIQSSEENKRNREQTENVLKEFTENEIKKASKEIAEKLDKDLKNEINDHKVGLIESLAIFVALFTFVSTNITIFSNVEYLAAGIWFMIIMLTCLIIFISVLHNVLHKKAKGWWLIPVGLLTLLVGLLFLSLKFNFKMNEQPKLDEISNKLNEISKSLEE
jgi:hypothetical protein